MPGGGEPSAVKSVCCSVKVLAMGTAATPAEAGLFMPETVAPRRVSGLCA
jgi:hypothetical protein